jgi:hypothetical protein
MSSSIDWLLFSPFSKPNVCQVSIAVLLRALPFYDHGLILKGLSHETDLAFHDMYRLVLGKIGNGAISNIFYLLQ